MTEEFRWPETVEELSGLRTALGRHCADPAKAGVAAVPAPALRDLLRRSATLLSAQPNVLDVRVRRGAPLAVVGDIHGQFSDLLTALGKAAAAPSATAVFAGDYVDRGCWGVEVLTLLLAALMVQQQQQSLEQTAARVVLLRGNHESSACADFYGFREEVRRKYDDGMYYLFRRVFTSLPLAAVVRLAEEDENDGEKPTPGVLVVHGGLWRGDEDATRLGTIEDLQNCSPPRGALDDVWDCDVVADALWSDPRLSAGTRTNASRGIGITFGPDVSIEFLRSENLSAVIRAHEGPDARDKCPQMPPIDGGYTVDHLWPVSGSIAVCTVFSAPDYPQFKPPNWTRGRRTLGAIARVELAKPTAAITFETFPAAPRPPGIRFGERF